MNRYAKLAKIPEEISAEDSEIISPQLIPSFTPRPKKLKTTSDLMAATKSNDACTNII